MTFSMNFPSIFNNTMDQNILGELYEALLDFGMIIDNNILKCNSQCPKLIHVLAILTILIKHVLSLTIVLRYFYNTLSGLGVDKLLHLVIAFLNSSVEKEGQSKAVLVGILFKIL